MKNQKALEECFPLMESTMKVPGPSVGPNTFLPMPWHLYIIECKDGKLYTGITNNLKRRIKAHNSGNGGRFTRYRCPVKLSYSEKVLSKSEALKREAEIKRLPRKKKLTLIGTF